MPCWLVAYDISRTATRNRVANRLEKAGLRLQRSVFIVEGGAKFLGKLERDLQEIIGNDDSLLIAPLCGRCLAEARISNGALLGAIMV